MIRILISCMALLCCMVVCSFAQTDIEEDALIIAIDDCDTEGAFCFDLPFSIISNYDIFTDNQPYTGDLVGCDIDTTFAYTYVTLQMSDDATTYIVNEWRVNEAVYQGQFSTINELVDSMNTWDTFGNWGLNEQSMLIEGGTTANEYSSMVITSTATNQMTLLGLNIMLHENGTQLNFPVGKHEVVLTDTINSITDTFNIYVQCIRTISRDLNFQNGESRQVCLDFSNLFTQVASVENICETELNGVATYNFDATTNCFEVSSQQLGTERACLLVCDSLGFCDTTYLNVTVQDTTINHNVGFAQTYEDTLQIGLRYGFCMDTTKLVGRIDTFYDACPDTTGNLIVQLVEDGTYCVKIEAIEEGIIDSTCIVICDDLSVCDTTTIVVVPIDTVITNPIDTLPIDTLTYIDSTIFINTSGRLCFESMLDNPVQFIVNDCPEKSGDNVNFVLDPEDLCVDFTGIELGSDTACILLVDILGNSKTINLAFHVIPPYSDTVETTINLFESDTLCLNTEQLGGTDYYLASCDTVESEILKIGMNNADLCISYTGISSGVDTSCVLICDNFDICDTTYLIVTVLDSASIDPPIAVDDSLETSINQVLTATVLDNDTIQQAEIIEIISTIDGGVGPQNGSAEITDEGVLTYTPNIDYCGLDSLTYRICNLAGCDTATVFIDVECTVMPPDDQLVIHNGFSPNGDGTNDVFVIDGIENFPNSQLRVYNRWGNVVYESDSYKNEWDGTWKHKEIPDGTYYYWLKINTNEEYTGYLHIHR